MRISAHIVLCLLAGFSAVAQTRGDKTTIPLCEGLTLVTAIAQPEGDYESIKTVESLDERGVRLRYSSEKGAVDRAGRALGTVERFTTYRQVLLQDLRRSPAYLNQYQQRTPITVPGTTAIGTSSAVLEALRAGREVELTLFEELPPTSLTADPNSPPSVFDYQLPGTLERVETSTVRVPVLVNGKRVELEAVHARGEFYGEPAEFFFLDDILNPLALRYRIGINSAKNRTDDRAVLEVVRISYRCTEEPEIPAAPELAGEELEEALENDGRVEVYDIYFSFNSHRLRDESQTVLAEIAAVMGRRQDWRLFLEGHTDSISSEAYNLELSQRRAGAVREALVERYHVDPERLTAAGLGESSPIATNDTLEGRARNRRVSLVLQR